jgi:hypothetical protein
MSPSVFESLEGALTVLDKPVLQRAAARAKQIPSTLKN